MLIKYIIKPSMCGGTEIITTNSLHDVRKSLTEARSRLSWLQFATRGYLYHVETMLVDIADTLDRDRNYLMSKELREAIIYMNEATCDF